MENIVNVYTEILSFIAEITVHTLELVGILIIMVGSVKAIMQILARLRSKQPINVMLELGRTLALALEFKMGAEIVNTVVVRDLTELAILAIVIALRALLALLIHWEIKNERREEELKQSRSDAEQQNPQPTEDGEKN